MHSSVWMLDINKIEYKWVNGACCLKCFEWSNSFIIIMCVYICLILNTYYFISVQTWATFPESLPTKNTKPIVIVPEYFTHRLILTGNLTCCVISSYFFTLKVRLSVVSCLWPLIDSQSTDLIQRKLYRVLTHLFGQVRTMLTTHTHTHTHSQALDRWQSWTEWPAVPEESQSNTVTEKMK